MVRIDKTVKKIAKPNDQILAIMKTKNKLFACTLVAIIIAGGIARGSVAGSGQKDTLLVLNSPGLEKLTGKLVDEYGKSAVNSEIRISLATQSLLDKMLSGDEDFAVISRENELNLAKEKVWVTVVGRDIIVPIYNHSNKAGKLISEKGINPASLSKLVSDGSGNWADLVQGADQGAVRFYFPSDIFVQERVAGYLGLAPEVLSQGALLKSGEVLSAVMAEKGSLGFCRLTDLLSLNNGILPDGIGILPLDRNGDGILSPMENIYTNIESFERGVWIGKYPRELYSNIYFLTNGNPAAKPAGKMLVWMLADGQNLLSSGGHSGLIQAERVTSMSKLAPVPAPMAGGKSGSLRISKFFLWGFVVIMLAIGTELFLRPLRRRKTVLKYAGNIAGAVINPESIEAPAGIFFDKYHTWAFMEKNGDVKIGLDDMIQKFTGTITRVEIIESGSNIKRGDKIVTLIQNGKQIHLYSPVSGKVLLNNEALHRDPAMIAKSPYDNGWLCTVTPSNWMKEIQSMQLSANYRKWLSEEITRFKDFMMSVISANPLEARLYPVMQDGGEISAGLLEGYGPHVWEEFQIRFLNTPR